MKYVRHRMTFLLTLIFMLSLLIPQAVSAAGDGVPLKMNAVYDPATKTAAVSIETTEAVTLSNYNVALAWDQSVLSLKDIQNDQADAMPSFVPNKESGSENLGKVGVMSGGSNVTIGAGETLLTYTFTAEKDPAEGTLFTLTVEDVADENAEPLSWKGQNVTVGLTISSGGQQEVTVDLPLKLIAKNDTESKTVTVDVVTEDPVTFSNYNVRLRWDQTAFTLTDIKNGQPAVIQSFVPNKDSSSGDFGKVAAMTGGSNVTVAAGETLASYVFTVGNAIAEEYEFTLEVEDVANENAESLPWKGQSCHCSLPGVKEDVQSGVIGEEKKEELAWAYYEISCKVVIAGPVTPVQPVFVASYDEHGRMLSFSIIFNGGGSTTVADDPDVIKLFWVNSAGVSQCKNAEIRA